MEEQLLKIIEHYTLSAFQVALISIAVSVITFFLTNFFENRLLQWKLEIEHK